MKKLLTAICLIGLLILPVFTEEIPKLKSENCIKQLTKNDYIMILCIDNIKYMMFSNGSLMMIIKYIDGKEYSIECDCADKI